MEARAQMEKKSLQKEKETKEENLRVLAQKAREERAGVRAEGIFLLFFLKLDRSIF